jgi:hypothetical protein
MLRVVPQLKLVLGLLFALAAPGCMVPVADHHGPTVFDNTGTLSLDWTVDNSHEPVACDDFGADSIELIVYDRRGDEAAHIEQNCDDFGSSVDLPEDVYSLDATLLDRHGQATTTTVALDDIYIYASEETVIPMDFPNSSLL